jgi:glycosyltransferase involved in cell wall biosynthesis
MRIALVTDTYVPQVNGVTTVVRRMVQALRRSGHQVGVVAPRYPEPEGERGGGGGEAPDELRIPSLPFPPYPAVRLTLPFRRRVTRFLDQLAPQVIHVATEGPLGLQGRAYALGHDIPLVTSFHTDFPRYARDYGVGALADVAWRWLTWFHEPSSLVHTPGETIRDVLRRRGLSQAVVWGRAVDTAFFHPDRRSATTRAALGAADDTCVILHVGRLAAEKNLEVLVEALHLAHGALAESAVFAVAGDGPSAPRVRDALPWARHLGFLDRARLAELYAAADVCVLPSASETCGLVALEAMAAGLAVVAADAGGFQENIRHRRSGLLVPPRDATGFAMAIVDLALNPARRRLLAAGARDEAAARDVAGEDHELLSQYVALITPPGKEASSCVAS